MSWLNPGRWMLYGALALAVVFGVMALDQSRQAKGYDKAQAEYTAKALAASEAARLREAAWQAQLTKANHDAKTRTIKLAADGTAARAAADGLRSDLAKLRANLPTLTRQAIERYADTASVVFAECSERYSGMAAKADGHASDQQTLEQGWAQ